VRAAAADAPEFVAAAARPGSGMLLAGRNAVETAVRLRRGHPELPILIPGVGTQGGDLAASVAAGVDAHGERAILAVSRAILYAGDGNAYANAAASEARSLRDRINSARSGQR